mmetsp:Transcript_3523/g.3950  ORF Transcript_3523/g.3950 Transcript_3523/m.3950 type:complete len:200 (-) Transcript_3523:214-813(-)
MICLLAKVIWRMLELSSSLFCLGCNRIQSFDDIDGRKNNTLGWFQIKMTQRIRYCAVVIAVSIAAAVASFFLSFDFLFDILKNGPTVLHHFKVVLAVSRIIGTFVSYEISFLLRVLILSINSVFDFVIAATVPAVYFALSFGKKETLAISTGCCSFCIDSIPRKGGTRTGITPVTVSIIVVVATATNNPSLTITVHSFR